MSFWQSELGKLTGDAQDAFAKTFKVIPDGTAALAKITGLYLSDNNGKKHFEIDWQLVDGDFKNQHVFQKIHAFLM